MEHYEVFAACFPELDLSEAVFSHMVKMTKENLLPALRNYGYTLDANGNMVIDPAVYQIVEGGKSADLQLFSFFWWHHMSCGILVPQSEIEPASPAVEAWSPNH